MAVIKYKGNEFEVPDGAALVEYASLVGVPLGCKSGNCGKCMVNVKEGMENLSIVNEVEKEFGLFEGERLFCQSKVVGGVVSIETP